MKADWTRYVGLCLGALPLFLFVGCPGEDEPVVPDGAAGVGSGGAHADADADADAGEAWDPVWHETTNEQWPTIGPENNPDCGPGCRIALNVPLAYTPAFGPSYTGKWIANESEPGVAFTEVGESVTQVIPHGQGFELQPSLWGDFVSYRRVFGIGDGQVEVRSLVTGEKKIAFRYLPGDPGDMERTVLGSKYVYWVKGGIFARHLLTGEVKQVGFGACWSYCATESQLICEDGTIFRIDPEASTGSQVAARTPLDATGQLQTDGACSPDRKRYVWVDYRDPPGPGSDPFFDRSGGEIYMHDFETGKTRRLTFDSPITPRGKVYPAIGGDLVVWNEPPASSPNPNPQDYQSLLGVSSAVATLDLVTGERCQLASNPARVKGYKSVHGRHVYGQWFYKADATVRLVDLDLDDPSLAWQCSMTPGWK